MILLLLCVSRFQKEKETLKNQTAISRSRRQKLLDSLGMLTHDAEKEKSFASKANRGQVRQFPCYSLLRNR
jgi:hypothetical protein